MLSFKGRPDFAVLIVHVGIDDVEVAVECCVERVEIAVCRFGPKVSFPMIFVLETVLAAVR